MLNQRGSFSRPFPMEVPDAVEKQIKEEGESR